MGRWRTISGQHDYPATKKTRTGGANQAPCASLVSLVISVVRTLPLTGSLAIPSRVSLSDTCAMPLRGIAPHKVPPAAVSSSSVACTDRSVSLSCNRFRTSSSRSAWSDQSAVQDGWPALFIRAYIASVTTPTPCTDLYLSLPPASLYWTMKLRYTRS